MPATRRPAEPTAADRRCPPSASRRSSRRPASLAPGRGRAGRGGPGDGRRPSARRSAAGRPDGRRRIAVDGRPIGARRRAGLPRAPQAGRRHLDRAATGTPRDRPRPGARPARRAAAGCTRSAGSTRTPRGCSCSPTTATGRSACLHPRLRRRAGVRRRLARPLDPRPGGALERGVELDEGVAAVRPLAAQTRHRGRRLADVLEPPPDAAPDLVPGHDPTRAGSASCGGCSATSGAPVARLVRVRIGRCGSTTWPPARCGGSRRPRSAALGASGRARRLTLRARRRGRADPRPVCSGDVRARPGPRDREPRPARPPRRIIVALDGPASSGKCSVGAAAARELGYRFFDTGLLYRALTGLAPPARALAPTTPAPRRPRADRVDARPTTAGPPAPGPRRRRTT